MKNKIDINKKIVDEAGKYFANYYDKMMLETLLTPSPLIPKIIGHKKVRVPKYFTVKVPVIEKHYNYSDYGECAAFEGYLINFKEIKLFKIGTKIEEQPIYKIREKGKKITFSRYKKL